MYYQMVASIISIITPHPSSQVIWLEESWNASWYVAYQKTKSTACRPEVFEAKGGTKMQKKKNSDDSKVEQKGIRK